MLIKIYIQQSTLKNESKISHSGMKFFTRQTLDIHTFILVKPDIHNGPNHLVYQASSKRANGHPTEILLDVQQIYFLPLDVQQIFTPSSRRLVGRYLSATRRLIENFYQTSSTKSSTRRLVEQKIWANILALCNNLLSRNHQNHIPPWGIFPYFCKI